MNPSILYCIFFLFSFAKGIKKSCLEDVKYQYTQCDQDDNRWRVAVPQSESCLTLLYPYIVKGQKCNLECGSGYYPDTQEQKCLMCPAGKYSMGGGIRLDDWNSMPKNFVTKSERVQPLHRGSRKEEKEECAGEWRAVGKYLMVNDSRCMTSLQVTFEFVKEGWVAFEYENADEDVMFAFEIENERCEVEGSGGRNLKNTEQFSRRQFKVQAGNNKLMWRVLSVAGMEEHKSLKTAPKIRSIEVQGVASTSECSSCKAGTFSKQGATSCEVCPANTFSSASSNRCNFCDPYLEFSPAGSSKCFKKEPCSSNDYYEALLPCDSNKMTRQTYHWNTNSTCNANLASSVQLPPDGAPMSCPPCNPGSQLVDGRCSFCASDEFSTGVGRCERCPSSTSPSVGLFINSFANANLTLHNISSRCISSVGVDKDCRLREGWRVSGGHMATVHGNHPSSFLLFNMHIGGFRNSHSSESPYGDDDGDGDGNKFGEATKTRKDSSGFKATPIAYISFVFELTCQQDCILHFIKKESRQPLRVAEQWTGNTERQKYTLPIFTPSPVTFSWTFQQKSESSSALSDAIEKDQVDANVARLFSINVTNTLQGGAAECQFCPQGSNLDGCIPCPKGFYIDTGSRTCRQCQGNTALKGAWGREACEECGEGLKHSEHQACVSSCRYHSALRNHSYNFQALAGHRSLMSAALFTTGGFKYVHVFNVSICSNHLATSPFPLATCASNLTINDEQETSSPFFKSPICRITSLPTETSKPQFLNPLNFGDQLIAVTDNPDAHVIKLLKQAHLYNNPNVTRPDVFFIFKSDSITKACKTGRTSVVVLRCWSEEEERLSLPSNCPDGTCDGCNLVLLWLSKAACPLCTLDDFSLYKEDCENGSRQVIKQPTTKHCYIEAGTQLRRTENCTVLWFFRSSSSVWLKVTAAAVAVVSVAGLVSIVVLLACWRKNKKLEYKYMQLIESSAFNSRDSLELSGVDSCGLEENEEEENFDAVQFKSKASSKSKFLSRLRHGRGGEGDGTHVGVKRDYYEKNGKEERMCLT